MPRVKAIEARGLGKRFNSVVALDGVDRRSEDGWEAERRSQVAVPVGLGRCR